MIHLEGQMRLFRRKINLKGKNLTNIGRFHASRMGSGGVGGFVDVGQDTKTMPKTALLAVFAAGRGSFFRLLGSIMVLLTRKVLNLLKFKLWQIRQQFPRNSIYYNVVEFTGLGNCPCLQYDSTCSVPPILIYICY